MEEVDASLLRRVAAGDRAAFDELYRRNAGWLAVRLRRRCADPEVAAEVLQETFLSVWRAAGGYRGDGTVGGWLWTIAGSRLIDARRRAAARPRTVDDAHDPGRGAHPSAEDQVLVNVWDARVAGALRGLSPELRAVLRATVLDGMSVRETALLLGVPEGNGQDPGDAGPQPAAGGTVVKGGGMDGYHVSDADLTAYAGERLDDIAAWSVEAHLDGCERCRSRVVPDSGAAAIVEAARPGPAALPVQGRVRRATRRRRVALLIGAGPGARAAGCSRWR